MAWVFMSTDDSKVVWDCIECTMPLLWNELTAEENNCSQGDMQGAHFCTK